MTRYYEPAQSSYTPGQRIVCATLGVAGTISVTTTATLANVPAPAFTPVVTHNPQPQPRFSFSPNVPAMWQSGHQALNSPRGFSANPDSTGRAQTASAVRALLHGQQLPTSHSQVQTSAANDLNLASRNQTFQANNIANFKEITIQVGGTKEVVTLATKLTAAEVVAAEQVITGGSQTIKLSGVGTANGGTINLNSSLLSALDSSVGGTLGAVTVTHGVKVVDTLGQLSLGSLTNYGSILTASSSQGSTDTISAGAIVNAAGGKIGSYSPPASGNGSSGLYAADPSLSATTSISNSGAISSAGNLTISAPVVNNTASHGAGGSISAAQNVNVNTQVLNNSGVIAAISGNANVASTGALALNGTGGSLQAQNGNINLSSTNADVTATGGNFESQNLNINAGTGNVTANIDTVSGLVNASGNCIHINADTADLKLGSINASGDPMFTNVGNLSIDGYIAPTNGQDLTLIAGGNIVSATGNTGLDTSSATGNGGNLTLVAGANFAVDKVTSAVTVTDTTNAGHGTAGGGTIDLTQGGGITTVTTASSKGNAGYVQMVAYAGTTTGSGEITFPSDVNTVTMGINAQSTSGGTNGNVSLIAGATSGTGITLGNVGGTSGAAFLANNVTLNTATPSANGGAVFSAGGTATNGINSFSTSGNAKAADITVLGNTFITGNFTATTGGAFNNAGFQLYAIGLPPGGGSLDGSPGRNVTISAGQDIFVGSILAFGGGGQGSGSATSNKNGGAGGNGGNISLTSTSGSITGIGYIDVSGGGGGGGAGASETSNATNGGAGGQAGQVTLIAAKDIALSFPITAYDGGAGGAGGPQIGGKGVGGGGGGGSALGGGGGGGGGGLGNTNSEFAAGGGGGFGGWPTQQFPPYSAYSGGGGSGTFDAGKGGGVATTGGGGGNFYGFGLGSAGGNAFGFNAGAGGGDGGGGTSPMAPGGTGALTVTTGGTGGQSTTGAGGTGASGGVASIVTGHGLVSITAGGVASGATAGSPIDVETSTLFISSGGSTTANFNVLSTSGAPLSLVGANVGVNGTLTLSSQSNTSVALAGNGTININDPVIGGTVVISTSGSSGPNNIAVNSGINLGAGSVTLTAGAGGSITGTAVIESQSLTLTAAKDINVLTFASSLSANSSGGNVTISINNTTSTLGASSAGSGDSFSLFSLAPIIIAGGINVPGAGGSIVVNTTSGAITQTSGTLSASSVALTAGTSIGTSKNPILTNATTVTGTTGSTGDLAVSDANAGTLTFDAKTASSGTLTLNSVASQLNVVEAPYTTVGITVATTPNANVLLNSGNSAAAVLGGSGTFTVSTTGNIDVGTNTSGIKGSSVSLNSSSGSIGALRVVPTSSGTLILNASGGNVNVSDSLATSSVTGAANSSTGTFSLVDTAASGTGLTVTSPVTGATINLSTTASAIDVQSSLGSASSSVTVNSAAALSVDSKATITGASVNLSGVNNSGTAVTLGGTISGNNITVTGTGSVADVAINGNVGTSLSSKVQITTTNNITATKGSLVSGVEVDLDSTGNSVGTALLPVNTAAGTLTSNVSLNSFINQTGNVALAASSGGGTFSLTAAGNLNVTGNLSAGGTIAISATGAGNTLTTSATIGVPDQSNVTLTSAGNVGNNSTVFGTTVNVTAGGNFSQSSSGDIVSNNASVSATGTLTASGKFESGNNPGGSTLGLSSTGTLLADSASSLGTAAHPFNNVTVNMTGANTGTIAGAVNAQGGIFQFLDAKGAKGGLILDTTSVVAASTANIDTTKGSGSITLSGSQTITGTATVSSASTLTVNNTASINDGTDTFSAVGAVSIAGSNAKANIITDSTFGLTTSGAVTLSAGTGTGNNIFTSQGTISAGSFANSGSIDATNSLSVTTSGTGAALSNLATGAISGGNITLTNNGTGQTSNAGSIKATSLTFNTSNLSITGGANSTSATSALTIQNLAGNLNISGTPGSLTTGAGASVTLAASAKNGNIVSGAAGQATDILSGLNQANSFTVTAGGTFTSALTGITVAPDGKGNGGTIDLAVSNVLFNGSGTQPNFALSAIGTTGTGGTIILNLPGTATNGITVGNAPGNYSVLAFGQSGGGNITIATPGQLTVNTTAPANFNINATNATGSTGAGIALSGTKGVLIIGNLDTHTGTGTAGDISITSTGAKTPFAVGATAGATNGQILSTAGGLVGDAVTITTPGGVTIATGDQISASSALTINGSTLGNSGNVTAKSLTISSAGNVTVTAGSGTFSPLSSFSATSTGGSVTIAAAPPPADSITLSAVKGAVIFGTGVTTLTAVKTDANSDGGTINIAAKTMTVSSAGLNLDAAAATGKGGIGGTIDVNLTGTTNLLVGGTGKGVITVQAQNDTGGVTNGNISLTTGGNLTITASSSTFNVGTNSGNGNVTLAGKILHINNAASFATATNLQSLSLTSNSGTFTLGGATGVTNGISDAGLTIEAKQLTIANNGGAIYNGSLNALEATSSPLVVTAKGDIGKTTALLNISASKSTSMQLTSTTGNAYINVTGGNETYTASVAKTLQITSAGDLIDTGTVTAKALNLTGVNITVGNTLAITITANAGADIQISDGQSALVTLNSIKAANDINISSKGAITTASTITSSGSSNSITIQAGGAITTKGAISAGADIFLTAGGTTGSISQGAAITAGSAAGDTLTLTAVGKGVIVDAKTGLLATADTIQINTGAGTSGGSIGTSHTAPFKVSANNLTISAPGTAASAYINNSSASAQLDTATVGKTFDYTGALTGGASTINAPTVLISTSNITAAISTQATSLQITAAKGNISLTDSQINSVKLNTITASTGSVSVTSNGSITTSGVVTAGGGNLTITPGTNGNVVLGNTLSTTGIATIAATGTGTITDAGSGKYTITANTVNLSTQGANIGASKTALRTNTADLSLTTGTAGSVTVTNTNTSANGTDTLETANVGSLVLTNTNTNTKNTAGLNIGDIAASTGLVTISTNFENLAVTAGSSITTVQGNITLLDTYVANGANLPQIVFGNNSTVHASTTPGPGLGNVFIALGTVPTLSSLKQGVSPTGGSPTIITAGTTVFFGTTTNPNTSITTSAGDTLKGTGSTLSFTTGKNAASQISLGTNVLIWADPPSSADSGTITLGGGSSGITTAGGTTPISSTLGASSSGGGSGTSVFITSPAPISTSGSTITVQSSTISSSAGNISTGSQANTSLGATAQPYTPAAINGINLANALLTQGLVANSAQFGIASALSNAVSAGDGGNDLNAASSNNAVTSFNNIYGIDKFGAVSQSDDAKAKSKNNNLQGPTSQSMPPKVLTGRASNSDHQTLDNGPLLLSAEHDTVVETPHGSINVAAGSFALLVAFEDGLGVYNLHDEHKGAVVLNRGGESIMLAPGQCAVVTPSSKKSFEQLNPTQFVTYRNVAGKAAGADGKIYRADFDLKSMLGGLKPLRDMLTSESPRSRKAIAKMLKTAAILSALIQNGESFAFHIAPPVTAYAPQADR